MAISLQMHSGLDKKIPFCHKSSYNASCFRAKMVALQSGKANFYQVLSLDSNNVGLDEIKKAYRCKALKYHPDICHTSMKEESTTQFLEIKQAYETLSDPISREVYDYELGLMDSTDRNFGSWEVGVRRGAAGVSREVWERQLQGLKMRSMRRTEKRRM